MRCLYYKFVHQNLNKITIFTTIGFLEQSVVGRCSRSWTGRTRAGSGQGFCKMWQSKREEIKNRNFWKFFNWTKQCLRCATTLERPFEYFLHQTPTDLLIEYYCCFLSLAYSCLFLFVLCGEHFTDENGMLTSAGFEHGSSE